jgi:hypothetical protein
VASKSVSDLQVIEVQHLYVQVSFVECILSQDIYNGFQYTVLIAISINFYAMEDPDLYIVVFSIFL